MTLLKSLKFWRICIFSLVGICLLALCWIVRSILTPFLLAFLLAYLFSPAVKALTVRDIPRGVAIALVYALFALLLVGLIMFGIPEMFRELYKLADSLPRYANELEQFLAAIQAKYQQAGLPPGIVKTIDANLGKGEEWLGVKLQSLIDGGVALLGALPLLILAPVLSIYMLYDWERMKSGLKTVVPNNRRPAAIHLGQEINTVFRKFWRGNLVVSVIVGVLTGIGMKLIGMEYALLIGIVSGLFEIIPYFGPVIAAVPALALALLKSPSMVLWVLGVIFIIQQLESNLIQPKIVGDSLGLHPLVLVFVLLAGGELFGVWGMLFAVPTAAVIRVILQYVYLKLV